MKPEEVQKTIAAITALHRPQRTIPEIMELGRALRGHEPQDAHLFERIRPTMLYRLTEGRVSIETVRPAPHGAG